MVDYFLGGQVALVANQQLVDILTGIPLDLLQPLLHIVERLLVRAIVYDNDAMGAPII